jgi:hypothetical protein
MMALPQILGKAALQGKLAHAHIFSGNNQEKGQDVVREITKLLAISPADCLVVTPELEGKHRGISIGQIRSVRGFLHLSAWNSHSKAVQILEAHTMNEEAQSALLKLLEEPVGDAYIFLHTAFPNALLDTVRSRAQEYAFYSFEVPTVAPDRAQEFEKLQAGDLSMRFAYAKKLAETPEHIQEIVSDWLVLLREKMYAETNEKPDAALQSAHSMRVIQETVTTLRETNVHPKTALERILLTL